MNNSYTWHIAGLGAIGALCNATALKNQLSVTPIVRNNSHSYCTHFTDIHGNEQSLSTPLHLQHVEQITHLLVPLKSYDVIPFLQGALEKLSANAQVVLCHNGMGTVNQAIKLLPKQTNLYFCTSSHGVYKRDRNAIYAGVGESWWQQITFGNPNRLDNDRISQLLPNAKMSDNLDVLLWQKLIINCAINPLTAIHKVKNGELADQRFQQEIEQVVAEACNIAQASGVDIEYLAMLKKVHQVIVATGANTSSMLQDISAGRTSEIDFITGYLLAQAKRLNLPLEQAAPTNLGLFNAVNELGRHG